MGVASRGRQHACSTHTHSCPTSRGFVRLGPSLLEPSLKSRLILLRLSLLLYFLIFYLSLFSYPTHPPFPLFHRSPLLTLFSFSPPPPPFFLPRMVLDGHPPPSPLQEERVVCMINLASTGKIKAPAGCFGASIN